MILDRTTCSRGLDHGMYYADVTPPVTVVRINCRLVWLLMFPTLRQGPVCRPFTIDDLEKFRTPWGFE